MYYTRNKKSTPTKARVCSVHQPDQCLDTADREAGTKQSHRKQARNTDGGKQVRNKLAVGVEVDVGDGRVDDLGPRLAAPPYTLDIY